MEVQMILDDRCTSVELRHLSHGSIKVPFINALFLMAHSRPAKRQRVGGAYHDPVPFVDDFSLFHAREGRLVRAGNEVITASDERAPQHEADRTWNAASSWLPVDDSQFALDPDSEWYDEVMDGEVTEDHVPVDGPLSSSRPKKRVRSKLSVSLHLCRLKNIGILRTLSGGLMSCGRTFIAKHTSRR